MILNLETMIAETKKILITAALLAALAVMIGAFGAHGLKPLLTEFQRLETFDTAVKYHFYHVFALFALGMLSHRLSLQKVRVCFWLFLTGILIFSGSLYALSLTNIAILGAVTPIGGALLILGWFSFALAIRTLA